MQEYGNLNKILKNKSFVPMEELKKILKKNEYKTRQDLLNFLYSELENINPNVNPEKCKYLYKIFRYFECAQEDRDKEQILTGLKKTTKLCKSRLNKYKGQIDFDNNIYNKILSIIHVTLLNLANEKKEIVDTKETNNNNISVLRYIIYELKNYNYLFELLKTFPKYIMSKNENGQYLVEELIDKYIKISLSKEYNPDIIYYEKVIKLFIDNPKFTPESNFEKQLLEKIKSNIKNVQESDRKDEEKQKSFFFLNELIGDIKKKDVNNKTLNDVAYKYDIKPNNTIDFTKEMLQNITIDKNKFLDLRNLYTITIDGPGTSLYDDACSIQKLENGTYLLSVFVTDVASFVPRASLIDNMAYEKAETIYMPQKVITMLPPGLTKTLTLKENQDRTALGHFFILDQNMNCLDFRVQRCLINVDKNYNYNEIVNTITTSKNYDELEMINNMADVAIKLHSTEGNRETYRALKQLKKDVNTNGIYDPSIGSLIIMEFMTLTNYYIADYFNQHPEIPFIYRINTGSYGEDVKKKIIELSGSNIDIKKLKATYNAMCPPSIYSTQNLGHQGLNLKSYCHSTNPLRNYASLECQRLIIDHIINDDTNIDLEKEWIYIKNLCNYMNDRLDLNKTFIKECNSIKKK
jgi:exoribonuclease R